MHGEVIIRVKGCCLDGDRTGNNNMSIIINNPNVSTTNQRMHSTVLDLNIYQYSVNRTKERNSVSTGYHVDDQVVGDLPMFDAGREDDQVVGDSPMLDAGREDDEDDEDSPMLDMEVDSDQMEWDV